MVKVIETKSRRVLARGWGEAGMRSQCLMGTEVQFGRMKISGDG